MDPPPKKKTLITLIRKKEYFRHPFLDKGEKGAVVSQKYPIIFNILLFVVLSLYLQQSPVCCPVPLSSTVSCLFSCPSIFNSLLFVVLSLYLQQSPVCCPVPLSSTVSCLLSCPSIRNETNSHFTETSNTIN